MRGLRTLHLGGYPAQRTLIKFRRAFQSLYRLPRKNLTVLQMKTRPRSSRKPGKGGKDFQVTCKIFTLRLFSSKLHEARRKRLHQTKLLTDLWGSQALLGQFVDLLLHISRHQLQPGGDAVAIGQSRLGQTLPGPHVGCSHTSKKR